MEKVIANGKSVDEAVKSALEQLGTTEDKVNIKILEQPSKRLFGLMGTKDAVVEVEVINTINPIEEAKSFLNNLFKTMGISVTIEQFNRAEHVELNLVGKDLGILIGRRGQTLDALQYLVNVVANKHSKHEGRTRVILDAEFYRSRRKSTLEDLAEKLADKVLRTGKDVVLEPMTAMERKIIHSQLQDHPKVETYSLGEEPNRKVVITKK